jgi:nicotinamidase-related amidase
MQEGRMSAQAAKLRGVERFQFGRGDALVLVDVQMDFLSGGSSPVPGAEEIIAPANRLLEMFSRWGLPIFATRDWHPRGHRSFIAQGGPWPPHCVAATPGARFAPGLRLPSSAVVVSKASDPARDAASGFDGTDLDARLRKAGVRRLVIAGLPTEYCVRATALDALLRGFSACIVEEAVRAVEARAGRRAMAELADKGVVVLRAEAVAA